MQNLEVIISTLLIVVAVATVLVNIVVEVLKKITWDLIPTNLLAFIVAETITLLAFFAICQVRGIPVVWYMVAAAVVLGLIVAYAAMFGFDKLRELIEQLSSRTDITRNKVQKPRAPHMRRPLSIPLLLFAAVPVPCSASLSPCRRL